MKTSAPTQRRRAGRRARRRGLVAAGQLALGRRTASRRRARAGPRGPTTTTSSAPAGEQQGDDRRAGGAAAGRRRSARPASRLSTQRSALVSAASTTIAVPCWSSWKTGMSSALAQPGLDLEAARGGDVLEVDAAEAGGDHLDGLDDLVDVLGGQADRPGVDVGEPLEQRGLALHHRQRRARADVAEAEHGRAVGDDRDRVALDGQPADVLGVARRAPCETRPTPGVYAIDRSSRVRSGTFEVDLDLAAEVQQEGPVADLVHLDALDLLDARDQLGGCARRRRPSR